MKGNALTASTHYLVLYQAADSMAKRSRAQETLTEFKKDIPCPLQEKADAYMGALDRIWIWLYQDTARWNALPGNLLSLILV